MKVNRIIRTVVCALALSVLPAVPAGASASVQATGVEPRPDLAGLRVQSPNSAPIYLIDPDGYRRWIPDPATYDSLFRDWGGVVVDLGTNRITEGPALDHGAFLAIAPGTNPVYLVSNGQKRWIVSPATMDKYWFDWAKIREVPGPALDAIPTGAAWY
jgi:hypothetical protein